MKASDTQPTLSLHDAAKSLNVGITTLRSWCQSGKIKAQKTVQGSWIIERQSLMGYVATKPSDTTPSPTLRLRKSSVAQTPSAAPRGGSDKVQEVLSEALRREREIGDDLRRQLRDANARIQSLEQERTQHMAEMRALLSKDTKAADGVISRWLRR
jgi:hypothetical protein